MLNLIISGFQGARGVKYVIIIVLYKPHAHGFAAAVHTLYIAILIVAFIQQCKQL